MKNYKIIHKEELVGWYYVEAESEEDALQKFSCLVSEGGIDFSDLEMIDSSDKAVLDE